MNKVIWIDTETTGLNDKICAVIQIAGIIEIDGIETDTFNYKVKPFENAEIQEGALKAHGISVEEMNSYPEMSGVKKQFELLLGKYINKFHKSDKFIIAAYNAKFDVGFLRAFWKRNNDKYYSSWFFSQPSDIMNDIVTMCRRIRIPVPKSLKLQLAAEALGIKTEGLNLHKALEDIRLTKRIDAMINERLRRYYTKEVT